MIIAVILAAAASTLIVILLIPTIGFGAKSVALTMNLTLAASLRLIAENDA